MSAEEAKVAAAAVEEDDVDLFGSDSEEESPEAKAERQKILDAYKAKKQAKPHKVAKSTIKFDVKPWEAETDMAELEKLVREISMDGLIWGNGELNEVGY
eukprot:Pgem_evm1s17140